MSRIIVRQLSRQPYESVFNAMKAFTGSRDENTADELWWVEHDPVFTQGQAGKEEHLLMPGDIPVVQVDRGGQVTYHGPGQIVGYPMIDLKRKGIGVRDFVTAIETSMTEALAACGVSAYARPDAPGVYVAKEDGGHLKIGSLGIRVRRGCSYHGLSLNVKMDLSPFMRINPCGYQGLEMTQIADLMTEDEPPEMSDIQGFIQTALLTHLGYESFDTTVEPTAILRDTTP